MNFKVIALALTLTVACWAQTSSQTSPVNPEKPAAGTAAQSAACHHGEAKDGCCCTKMSGAGKDAMSCCAHHDAAAGKDSMPCCHHEAKDGEQTVACCNGKDGKSCMKEDKTLSSSTAAGCCAKGASCGKGMTCCDSAKDAQTTAMACCSRGRGASGRIEGTK
jgi:hypothetical protein